MQQAKSANILRGAYHFFRPTKTREDQADNFLQALELAGGLEANDCHLFQTLKLKMGSVLKIFANVVLSGWKR